MWDKASICKVLYSNCSSQLIRDRFCDHLNEIQIEKEAIKKDDRNVIEERLYIEFLGKVIWA